MRHKIPPDEQIVSPQSADLECSLLFRKIEEALGSQSGHLDGAITRVVTGGNGAQRNCRSIDHKVSGLDLQARNQLIEISLNYRLCPHKLRKCLFLSDRL